MRLTGFAWLQAEHSSLLVPVERCLLHLQQSHSASLYLTPEEHPLVGKPSLSGKPEHLKCGYLIGFQTLH